MTKNGMYCLINAIVKTIVEDDDLNSIGTSLEKNIDKPDKKPFMWYIVFDQKILSLLKRNNDYANFYFGLNKENNICCLYMLNYKRLYKEFKNESIDKLYNFIKFLLHQAQLYIYDIDKNNLKGCVSLYEDSELAKFVLESYLVKPDITKELIKFLKKRG